MVRPRRQTPSHWSCFAMDPVDEDGGLVRVNCIGSTAPPWPGSKVMPNDLRMRRHRARAMSECEPFSGLNYRSTVDPETKQWPTHLAAQRRAQSPRAGGAIGRLGAVAADAHARL